jgi:hypothetical protein
MIFFEFKVFSRQEERLVEARVVAVEKRALNKVEKLKTHISNY